MLDDTEKVFLEQRAAGSFKGHFFPKGDIYLSVMTFLLLSLLYLDKNSFKIILLDFFVNFYIVWNTVQYVRKILQKSVFHVRVHIVQTKWWSLLRLKEMTYIFLVTQGDVIPFSPLATHTHTNTSQVKPWIHGSFNTFWWLVHLTYQLNYYFLFTKRMFTLPIIYVAGLFKFLFFLILKVKVTF